MSEKIDLVYTWVDDCFPGYRQLLEKYAKTQHDVSPERTRDNLDLLRYSLRSVEKFAPWIDRIFIVSCRPQIPSWLNTSFPRVRIIHHDEIMEPQITPTFNSFAIVSQLHRIPGLSPRFLYLEDDILFLNSVTMGDFITQDDRIKVYRHWKQTPTHADLNPAKSTPWNMALANANVLLDKKYGLSRRSYVSHVPLLIDIIYWKAMIEQWRDRIDITQHSRFRSIEDIAPEYLYPHFLLGEGLGVPMPPWLTHRYAHYAGLENFYPLTAYRLVKADLSRPKFCNFNDNFGELPSPSVERLVQSLLRKWFPQPSYYER